VDARQGVAVRRAHEEGLVNPDHWARLKDVFHRALERAPEARAGFVASAAGGDAELLAELERLLAAHDQAGSFIERSPVSGAGSSTHAVGGRPLMSGRLVGRFQVGRLLGVGGMGEVYAARDVELGREVALKIATDDDVTHTACRG
jgi:eukaryotic-like serine/threonine-protein kinase